MHHHARSSLLLLALACAGSHAAAPDPALVGCWRAARITSTFATGAKAEDASGRCMLQFDEREVQSRCSTASGKTAGTTYDYRIVRPNFYAATMTASTFRTDLIGATREYEYHVQGESLQLTTRLKPAIPATATTVTRVETQATRVPCP
jgi:hypothetical protein